MMKNVNLDNVNWDMTFDHGALMEITTIIHWEDLLVTRLLGRMLGVFPVLLKSMQQRNFLLLISISNMNQVPINLKKSKFLLELPIWRTPN
jgi:hypothetical protein